MRYMKLWLHCGVGFVLLVVYLSLTPAPVDAGEVGDVKVGHFLAYGWLMFWFCQLYRRQAMKFSTAAALITLGVLLEFAQGLTGYRTFAYGDMVDNALGVAAGLALGMTRLQFLLAGLERRWLAAMPGSGVARE